jgi:hypothetical protein
VVISRSSTGLLNMSAVVGTTATTDADRGPSSSTASSPITSCAPSVTSTISSPRSDVKVTLTIPSASTKSRSPGSPW